MLNVFVICNDKRIDSLIEHFQPFFKSKIRCAFDFDNGLKEVFENRPAVVFIQSTIGTVSGETVSRHIKTLLGSASPRIVFMGDSDSNGKKGTIWCDDWITISESAQQLQHDFAAVISRSFPKDWQEIHKEMEKAASGSADAAQKARCFENISSDDPVLLLDEVHDSGVVLSGAAEKMSGSERSGFSGTDVSGLAPDIVEDKESFPYHNLYEDPLLKGIAVPSKLRFAWIFPVALFLLTLVGGVFYFWTLHGSDSKIPVMPTISSNKENVDLPATLPAKIVSSINGLPSFVRNEWRDLPYTSQHPGWERYVSPAVDFRIFREKGMIKALQGISRTQNGLSEVFLVQILEQFELNGPMPDGKENFENGFLLKNIVFPGVAELVTYREQDGGIIKAFVLEFSNESSI